MAYNRLVLNGDLSTTVPRFTHSSKGVEAMDFTEMNIFDTRINQTCTQMTWLNHKSIICTVFILILITGCRKGEQEEISIGNGAIFATVVLGGQLVPGATVSTVPATSEYTTSGAGNVLMENIPPGIYQVKAVRDDLGTGSAAVQVEVGDLSEVIIYMVFGAQESPFLNLSPVAGLTVEVGNVFGVYAMVSDDVDEPQDIELEWSTDVDGVISTIGAEPNGKALLEYTFETAGTRILSVTATDSDGNSTTKELTIQVTYMPDPLVLQPISNSGASLELNWSAADEESFESYVVYRQQAPQSGFSAIETITDMAVTTFTDDDIVLGQTYSYRIGLLLEGSIEVMSNVESGFYGGEYIDIGTSISMMRFDPNNQVIYALDAINNSLHFISTDLGLVTSSVFVGSSPSDMEFSLDHSRLYIANSGSNEITVVNLSSQSVETSYFVETNTGFSSGNPATLAVLDSDRLAFSSNNTTNNIVVVNINTGDHLYTDNTPVRKPYLRGFPDGSRLYAGETGTSSSNLKRFNVGVGAMSLVDNSTNGSNNEKYVHITNDGLHIFYRQQKFLANNLSSILGTFPEHIFAISSDGSRALGQNNLYNGQNFTTVGPLPVSTKVSVFNNNGQTAYLYDNSTSRLYIYEVE